MMADGLPSRPGGSRVSDQRRAVIDIGSNTVRLVIYGGPPRAPAVLWNEKVSARLGSDLVRTGTIPVQAMHEALAALARYALILRDLDVGQVETVATAAPRDAANGGEFLARVVDLGLDVKLLSGEEEAKASAWGVIGAFPGATGTVADLGGGSLELVQIADGACHGGASLPLGTLRLPQLRGNGRFEHKVAKLLQGAGRGSHVNGPLYLVGGTWRAFATFAMRSASHPLNDPHGFELGAAEADEVARTVQRSEPAELAKLRGISTMRSEKLPDAAALLRSLLRELKPATLVFSSWGLREGLHYRRLAPAEQALDPLLVGVATFAIEPQAGFADAHTLAAWTASAVGINNARLERIRLAAAHLAPALHRVEPNLRPAHALEWALDKRWIGIDSASRALLGAALLGSLGTVNLPDRLGGLADEHRLRTAVGWGLALRLAQRIGAGSRQSLAESRIESGPDYLTLCLEPGTIALATPIVARQLGALAEWLGLTARIEPQR